MSEQSVEEILKDYKESKQKSKGTEDWKIEKAKREEHKQYVLSKRFETYKKAEFIIRLLPPKDDKNIHDVFGYYYLVKKGPKQFETLWSPTNSGGSSPIEAKRKELYETLSKEDATEEAKRLNLPRLSKYYFVNLIDREFPDQGVKMWMFQHNSKGKGIMDDIMTLIEEYGIPWDKDNGYDIKVKCELSDSGKYYKYNRLFKYKDTSLSEDKVKEEKWVNESNNLDWQDIYTLYEKKDLYVKGFIGSTGENKLSHEEYLQLVLEQRFPYYDKSEKTFIIPEPYNPPTEMPDADDNSDILSSVSDEDSHDYEEDDNDDLPF